MSLKSDKKLPCFKGDDMAIGMSIGSYIAKIEKSSWMPLRLNFFTLFDIVISKVLSISIDKKGVSKSSLIL